jgi:hypothetical protein
MNVAVGWSTFTVRGDGRSTLGRFSEREDNLAEAFSMSRVRLKVV